MYGTIAVGTDGSQTAMIAEGVAVQLAGSSGGRVLFLSAFTATSGWVDIGPSGWAA